MSTRTREFEVSLPIGWADPTGRTHKTAVIQKMRGHEEALFYDTALSPGRLVTELLRGCLVRLGEVSEITSELVSQLYSADRNYLVVELRRITLGEHVPSSYTCPGCGGETTVTEDLSRLEVRRLEDGLKPEDIVVPLEDGYRDRDGTVHEEIRLRLPRGADEEFVTHSSGKDPLRTRDALILRCISSFGTLRRAALEAYGLKILRELTLGDRRRLYRAIEAESPGVDLRRTVSCAHCRARFDAVLEASRFFVLG